MCVSHQKPSRGFAALRSLGDVASVKLSFFVRIYLLLPWAMAKLILSQCIVFNNEVKPLLDDMKVEHEAKRGDISQVEE